EALAGDEDRQSFPEVDIVLDHERAEALAAQPSRSRYDCAPDGAHEEVRTARADSPRGDLSAIPKAARPARCPASLPLPEHRFFWNAVATTLNPTWIFAPE